MENEKKKKLTVEDLMAVIEGLKTQIAELSTTRTAAPAAKTTKKGEPRPHVHYVLKGFPTEKYPPQCLRVMKCLAQAAPEGGKMTETEIWDALMGEGNKLGTWNYRQTPFHIFKYYHNPMVDGDYLRGPFQE